MLTPLLDDRLTPADRAAVEEHLAGCAACRQTHALLQATAATLATRGPAEPPEDLAERAVRAAFTAEPARATDWLGQLVGALRWPALGTATAAAVLAVGLLTAMPQVTREPGVAPESISALLVTDDDVVSDGELLSDVLGEEE